MEYTEKYLNSIDEALADEAFMEKLAGAESKEAFKELFRKEKGIEIEDENVQAVFDKLESIKNGELSVEDLEDAAGGCRVCRSFAGTGARWGMDQWGRNPVAAAFGAAVLTQIMHNIFHGRR